MPQNFPFNGTVLTNNMGINGANPKMQLGGTEPGALYYETVEVAGTYYIVQNAAYNTFASVWVQTDVTKASFATAYFGGLMSFLTVPAGTPAFASWNTATGTSFTGNLAGNVVGNVTGNVTGNLSGATVTLTGMLQAGSVNSNGSYVPPVFTASGSPVPSTAHVVQDKVTASGASTTVTLAGSAAFTSANSYVVTVYDSNANTYVVLTAQTASSFTFSSTSTHVYLFTAVGT